jgi:hypothetical protein
MARYSIILPIIAVVIFSSCGDYPCVKADLNYRLIGFSDPEIGTIILRRFQKNTFTIKDSFVFNASNPIRFERFGDTLFIAAATTDALMKSDYDYQMFFPGAGRLFSITEIKEEQSYGTKKGKVDCINQISSCKVDGQPINIINFPNTIYLKK